MNFHETWMHQYELEIKEQSKQWISHWEHASKKRKIVASLGKAVDIFFWVSKVIIFGRKKTHNRNCADLLNLFNVEFMKK